jgi:hypothetical protein
MIIDSGIRSRHVRILLQDCIRDRCRLHARTERERGRGTQTTFPWERALNFNTALGTGAKALIDVLVANGRWARCSCTGRRRGSPPDCGSKPPPPPPIGERE